ncbi:phasin [Bradyrhizobium liaoningense]|uniref:phasin n=1 Tax=Bradyrhizobium liaoningense TaxID=43992 RepID=UPI001BA8D042|nr:phasin [Bradyrhizobium liaoningense]MBR0858854.1 phasin [Bradyrhizobium liaoningense]
MTVNDANVKAETNATANGTADGGAKLKFDMPFFNLQAVFGDFAEQGAARAKANFEQMKAASEEITEALREACSTNARRAADYGTKVIEISNTNTGSALEFLSQLADARSFADVVNLSTTHSRKTFEAASGQNRELWDLARKVATETAEPIRKSFNRVLHRAA